MGDYLWDKSGEPDAEVERLEKLLGGLRHDDTGRTFELPAELPPVNAARQTTRRRVLFRPALAAAAAILLMILAGVYVGVVRRGRDGGGATPVANDSRQTTSPKNTPEMKVDDKQIGNELIKDTPEKRDEAIVVRNPPDESEAGAVPDSFQPKRRKRIGRAREREERSPGEINVAATPRHTNRDVTAVVRDGERRAAKEQLMLALRVTSEKLSFVQRKTGGGRGSRPGPEEQHKL